MFATTRSRSGLSTGYAGVIADLGFTDETEWTGLARTWDDYTGLQWSRRIDLDAVPCDSPPPVPSSVMRTLPRAVQLVGGATIALGEPLPESLETSPRRPGSLTVIGRTEGLFGTTDSIAVAIDQARGRIGRIQLIYLDPDMSSVIEARLTDAFGPPTGGGGMDPAGIEWRNRVARVWLGRGTRFTVNLRRLPLLVDHPTDRSSAAATRRRSEGCAATSDGGRANPGRRG